MSDATDRAREILHKAILGRYSAEVHAGLVVAGAALDYIDVTEPLLEKAQHPLTLEEWTEFWQAKHKFEKAINQTTNHTGETT